MSALRTLCVWKINASQLIIKKKLFEYLEKARNIKSVVDFFLQCNYPLKGNDDQILSHICGKVYNVLFLKVVNDDMLNSIFLPHQNHEDKELVSYLEYWLVLLFRFLLNNLAKWTNSYGLEFDNKIWYECEYCGSIK